MRIINCYAVVAMPDIILFGFFVGRLGMWWAEERLCRECLVVCRAWENVTGATH